MLYGSDLVLVLTECELRESIIEIDHIRQLLKDI